MVKEKILVVDDEPGIRKALYHQLTRVGYNARAVENAGQAWRAIEEFGPNLIITDLIMPDANGLTLLREIRNKHGNIPVIIMTGQGNLKDAITALRLGAADFILKPFNIKSLYKTLGNIFTNYKQKYYEHNIARFVRESYRKIEIDNDIYKVTMVAHELARQLVAAGFSDELEAENFGVAIREAILNGIYHGNLELDSGIREDLENGLRKFKEEMELRRMKKPYADRRIFIEARYTPECYTVTIRDEGPGFDYAALPDPTDIENIMKSYGRGVFMIRIHSDEVNWSNGGNTIELRKYSRKSAAAQSVQPGDSPEDS